METALAEAKKRGLLDFFGMKKQKHRVKVIAKKPLLEPVLSESHQAILKKMEDNTNIKLWLKIRKMNNVERASPAHCIPSYMMLTKQVVMIGSDAETGQICKFSRVMGEDTS